MWGSAFLLNAENAWSWRLLVSVSILLLCKTIVGFYLIYINSKIMSMHDTNIYTNLLICYARVPILNNLNHANNLCFTRKPIYCFLILNRLNCDIKSLLFQWLCFFIFNIYFWSILFLIWLSISQRWWRVRAISCCATQTACWEFHQQWRIRVP